MSSTIVGNITRDPELTYTNGGAARVRFGVAVSRRRKNGDEWTEEASFFDVVAWRNLAENVAESIGKGMRVVIFGRFEQRTFEGRDGTERTVVELVAEEIGPSLRWAACTVQRTERRDSGMAAVASPRPPPGRRPSTSGEEPW